ncbi:hypothetical protein [Geobacter sp.]|uniref:hypothetical protein n=1 Tax=Geobacter sp. TaxID=46610 RepID=UPI0027B93CCA|nr:hypothetical protein [Geobacter sp.]
MTGLFLFFFTIWALGFLITIVHELGHAIFSGGNVEYIQIGIDIGTSFVLGKFIIYPLLPIAGGTKLTIENPSKQRVVLFASAGIIIGSVICILVGLIGLSLLPPETLAEVVQTHKLRFLLTTVILGNASIQTTIATAFLSSAILYGVQQIGNFFPVPGYDGHLILNAILPR